jgi:hypothetical protein
MVNFIRFTETLIIPLEKVTSVTFSPTITEEIIDPPNGMNKLVVRPAGIRISTSDPNMGYHYLTGKDAEIAWELFKSMSLPAQDYTS